MERLRLPSQTNQEIINLLSTTGEAFFWFCILVLIEFRFYIFSVLQNDHEKLFNFIISKRIVVKHNREKQAKRQTN